MLYFIILLCCAVIGLVISINDSSDDFVAFLIQFIGSTVILYIICLLVGWGYNSLESYNQSTATALSNVRIIKTEKQCSSTTNCKTAIFTKDINNELESFVLDDYQKDAVNAFVDAHENNLICSFKVGGGSKNYRSVANNTVTCHKNQNQ